MQTMKTPIRMGRPKSIAFFAALSTAFAPAHAEGIPEPSLVMYGVIRNVNGGDSTRLTSGTLTWVFRSAMDGQAISVSTTLTNINDQFSYVLRVPCEAVPAGFAASTNTLRLATPQLSYDRSKAMVNGAILASFAQPAPGDFGTFLPGSRPDRTSGFAGFHRLGRQRRRWLAGCVGTTVLGEFGIRSER